MSLTFCSNTLVGNFTGIPSQNERAIKEITYPPSDGRQYLLMGDYGISIQYSVSFRASSKSGLNTLINTWINYQKNGTVGTLTDNYNTYTNMQLTSIKPSNYTPSSGSFNADYTLIFNEVTI